MSSLKIGGGAQRNAVELGSSLYKKGYDVTFLTFYDKRPTYDYEGEHICLEHEEKKNPLSDFIHLIDGAREIKNVCKERDIDTVFSFLTRMNVQSILSKILLRNEAKIVVSVRNNPVQRNKKRHQRLIKMLYPKADEVVVQTAGIENILDEQFSIQNTTVIPNIADLQKFKERRKEDVLKEHEDIFDDDFVFITIGSLTEQKAQWHLIRSFKRLSKVEKDSILIVLGKGPLERKLKAFVKKMRLEQKVMFLGEVENVFPYLKRSDCFILTSLFEGFPNVLVEALSQDLPVISTDCISGPREILCPGLKAGEEVEYPYLGDYGILTKPFDSMRVFKTLEEKSLSEEENKLFKLMAEVKEDEKLRRRYSKGSKRVEDFEAKKIVPRWIRLIDQRI